MKFGFQSWQYSNNKYYLIGLENNKGMIENVYVPVTTEREKAWHLSSIFFNDDVEVDYNRIDKLIKLGNKK